MARGARAVLRRGLSCAVVALCLGAQLGTAAHYAVVEHAYCAEHGETVDVHSASSAHAAHHGTPPPAHVAINATDSTDEHSDAHDHCALAVDRSRDLALPPSTHAVVPAALLAWHPREPARVASLSRDALLLLAPKTSPPA